MTVIAIAKAYNAAEGKKYGNIQDAAGNKYLVPAGMNGVFQAGTTVDVPTRLENWTSGPVNIVSGRPGAAGSSAPATPPAASPTPAPAQSARMAVACDTDCSIFVTGIVGRAMGSGKFDITDIDLLTKAALAAWRDNLARAA